MLASHRQLGEVCRDILGCFFGPFVYKEEVSFTLAMVLCMKMRLLVDELIFLVMYCTGVLVVCSD